MSLPKITFIKGQGGFGRTLPGEDYISGIIFYDNTKPSGFSTLSGQSYTSKVLSLVDAQNLGIVNDYSDETKASATISITGTGLTASTYTFTVTDYTGSVELCTYSTSGGSSINAEATAIATLINTGTFNHNYTATATNSAVTITAPQGKGVALNSGTPLTATASNGSLTLTLTQFSGGIASKLYQYWYQISEYFRLQPNGVLYVMFSDVPTTYFSVEIPEIQHQAIGKIRQLAIFANAKTSISTGDITSINNAVVSSENTYGVSMSVVYSTDIIGTTSLTSLSDLSSLSANKVSVVIGQSGTGEGYKIYKTTNKSIPTLGACLGTISLSKVSDDIAWVGQYNISDGTECESVSFSNGQLSTQVSQALQEQLNGYRYIFLRKFIGYNGSFWNDSNCAISTTSDYAYIENNRTIDKAVRNVRVILTPELNSPITLNSDGTLTDVTINHFKGLCDTQLENMKRNGELSDYQTIIPDNQNVLSTSTINITLNLLPVGVARYIQVTVGFVSKL